MASLSREQHKEAAERWLSIAETLYEEDQGSLPVVAAGSIGQLHATLALYEPPPLRGEPLAPDAAFDPLKLYAKLEEQRATANITWRTLAYEAGVSASTLTRISQGRRPDADGLARLLAWLGTTDLAPYLAGGDS